MKASSLQLFSALIPNRSICLWCDSLLCAVLYAVLTVAIFQVTSGSVGMQNAQILWAVDVCAAKRRLKTRVRETKTTFSVWFKQKVSTQLPHPVMQQISQQWVSIATTMTWMGFVNPLYGNSKHIQLSTPLDQPKLGYGWWRCHSGSICFTRSSLLWPKHQFKTAISSLMAERHTYVKVQTPPWSRGWMLLLDYRTVHPVWGQTLTRCSFSPSIIRSHSHSAAAARTQFHAERLAVMWPGQTWAERLSAALRLKQKRRPLFTALRAVNHTN